MTTHIDIVPENGAVIHPPLSRLKKSPKNARKTPHGEAAINALAASMAAKGVLQPLRVEPEHDASGRFTGDFLVTIGEGRRQALLLRAKRKEIKKSEPVRCIVDTENNPQEISLDENVTRTDMHPADQFEAFKRLAEEHGYGAEEIAARFGVSAQTVRQRLRLGAVAPELMQAYRDEELTLEQLMAFGVSDDHARQRQVFDQLGAHRPAALIRRAMLETKVSALDRRAAFIGAAAYLEAGGGLLRDLFTEDHGGWFEDVGLLDQLVATKLEALADEVREREGWKWSASFLDYPHGHGWSRVYPHPVERSEAERAEIDALAAQYDDLVSQWDHSEDVPADVEAQLAKIDAKLQAAGDGTAYDADDIARGGVVVLLGYDGVARIERGFVRVEDEPAADELAQDGTEDSDPTVLGDGDPASRAEVEPEEDPGAPLPERLVRELTAHRTMALHDALAEAPGIALIALVHALAIRTFYAGYDQPTCLEIKTVHTVLDAHAHGVNDGVAGRKVAERHAAWAARLPRNGEAAWEVILAFNDEERSALLAHCVALTVNAVHSVMNRKPGVWAHAEALAAAVRLDMTTYWAPTADSYLGRVTKARIGEAVREGVSLEAADRLSALKKDEMAEAAEGLLAGTGWLPPLLRTVSPPLKAAEPPLRDADLETDEPPSMAAE